MPPRPARMNPVFAPGGVALAAFRPQTRPSDLVEQIERNVLGGMTRAEAAKFRPRTRPAGLAPPPEPVEEEPVVAEVEPEVDVEEPQIEITDQAVAISLRPDARPRNMNRIVARAQRSAPQEQQAAAAAPRTVRPSGTTPRTVAQIATTENALNMRRVNLIGVYGRPQRPKRVGSTVEWPLYQGGTRRPFGWGPRRRHQ